MKRTRLSKAVSLLLVRCGIGALPFLVLMSSCGWAAETATTDSGAAIDSGASLRLMNREVFVFRATLGPYHPSQRAAAAAALIREVVPKPGAPVVTSVMVGTNAEILVYGEAVFFITPPDIYEIQGETFNSVVERTINRLTVVLSEMAELRDRRGLVISVLRGTLGTAAYLVLIWLLARRRSWLEGKLIRLSANKADQLKSKTLRMLGLQNVAPFLRGSMTFVFWSIVAAATYIWLERITRLFPLTRPIGEQLSTQFVGLLQALGRNILHALPGLGVVLMVWILARFASSAVRRFFGAVARGRFESRFFEPGTAPITQRLCVLVIWITAIIVAFPYIPGSQTPAFRGISVMVGLMISLGSASLVGQLVGGLILVYNRSCRIGDYVRVGEYEGTIGSIGFFSSRLVTVLNEEIVIPNSQISGSALINYSQLAATIGVAQSVTVSIGYNTPWRQVHAMLIEAARRTAGARQQPEPTLVQKELGDFSIVYQLNVVLENPAHRVRVLSQLRANIQDVFNEYGVQIMSPHYMADPAEPALVPKSRWHAPPAVPSSDPEPNTPLKNQAG